MKETMEAITADLLQLECVDSVAVVVVFEDGRSGTTFDGSTSMSLLGGVQYLAHRISNAIDEEGARDD